MFYVYGRLDLCLRPFCVFGFMFLFLVCDRRIDRGGVMGITPLHWAQAGFAGPDRGCCWLWPVRLAPGAKRRLRRESQILLSLEVRGTAKEEPPALFSVFQRRSKQLAHHLCGVAW